MAMRIWESSSVCLRCCASAGLEEKYQNLLVKLKWKYFEENLHLK